MALLFSFAFQANADSVEIDGLYYDLNTTDRTATVTYQTTDYTNYSSLASAVTIPEKVTYNNVSFEVTTIADKAFANCTAIESISIPSTVTALGTSYVWDGSGAAAQLPFYNCTSLKNVRFEDGQTSITLTWHNYNRTSSSTYNRGMFAYCPLVEVYLGRNIEYKEYSYYPFEDYPQAYGYSAFYNQPTLTKATIGDNVTSIPSYLFYSCSSLKDVSFGKGLTAVPQYAFKGCALTEVELSNAITSIGQNAFQSNALLTKVNVGENVETIGDLAFDGCTSISTLDLGSSLKSIGERAFSNAGTESSNWDSMTFPETLESIGEYAFEYAGFKAVTIPDGVSEIGKYAFSGNRKLTSIQFGTGCEALQTGVLKDCSSLKTIILPEGIESIGDEAFANCTSMESISIPGTVTALGTSYVWDGSGAAAQLPFYNCTSLKNVRFEDGQTSITLTWHNNNRTSSSTYNRGMFANCPLEEVYIGRNLEYKEYSYYPFEDYPQSYGYSAFYNQSKLAKITIGPLCTELPSYLFYKNPAITLLTLPNVKKIGNSTFEECPKLTTLNLGNSLESVGNRAFYNCTNITKLTFPNSTESIGDYAFYNCNSVTEVTVGTGLKSIGSYGFYDCKSFTALILPDTFTTMGESAFESCTKLTVAKLGQSLTSVPACAFKNCTSLSEMVVPASAESIGNQAFYNDSGLATITMNEGLKTIGNEVFWNNSGIMQFSIPGTVTSMGSNCFYGCTRTTYLTFCDGEETLRINNTSTRSSKIDALTTNSSYYNRYYDYFYDCPIRFLTLGRNLTYSYDDNKSMYDVEGTSFKSVTRASAPFVNSQELRSVTIGPKVTFLYDHLFDGCTNLATLRMGANIESICTYTFRDCDNLKGVSFPESLQRIGTCAFYNCDLLASTEYAEATDHTLEILGQAFSTCNSLGGVAFPGQLALIDSNAFDDCAILSEVIFNNNPSYEPELTIGSSAFAKCHGINSLSFPGRLKSIGNYAFSECDFLIDVEFQDSPNAVELGYGGSSNGRLVASVPLFGNSNLEKLYIGRNIDYSTGANYGYSPFYNQAFLTDVKFSQAGTVTYCKDNLLYKVNNCESLQLPESLTSIGSYTFCDMSALEGITIPNKVTEIGRYAFCNDKALKYANLSTSCPWLKEGLFADCDSLLAITIPPVVTKMDTEMFRNCRQLATVTFEDNTDVLEMGYGASSSEYGLFRDCPIETLYLGRWLSYNTDLASRSPFYSIESLKNLTFGEPVGIVDKYMFSYCTGLEDVYLPDNIESVGLWGFRGCTSLESVRFSEKLSQVSDYGFSGCTSLDNVVFPASMTSIADNSFSDCTSLKTLDLGSKLMIIGPAAFKNDTALEGVELPESLYGLGVEAFANCTSLPFVAIKSISSVGKQAFENCSGLQWISLSDKTTSLGEDSFKGCTGIKYVKSYAQFPPEGLVNFAEDVVANGTLFVPEASLDYYQYSPTWENWYSIRPISDNILASSVSLDITEYSFKAAETVQLTATVGAEDATDKNVIWRSADPEIATVDETGLVTAISVGEVLVSAIAADGSGEKAECNISVLPTLVESISIAAETTTVKKGRTLEVEATVEPSTATNMNVVWTSSNPAVATVDENGLITALTSGNVEIVASAMDGSGVSKSFDLTVVPPTKGDSNDNDEVTITDAVNTANYAVGNEVADFCFEAADVNADNRITLSDASGTVTEVLNQTYSPSEVMLVRQADGNPSASDLDELVIDDFKNDYKETFTVDVRLADTRDYVALQADVKVPEGISLMGIEVGKRAEGSHSLLQRRIDDRTIRIALFDLNNSAFSDEDAALFRLVVKADKEVSGNISMSRILASDSNAKEYTLGYSGGHGDILSEASGLLNDGNPAIDVVADGVVILDADGKDVHIFNPEGILLNHFVAAGNDVRVNLNAGVYVVTIENTSSTVIVK